MIRRRVVSGLVVAVLGACAAVFVLRNGDSLRYVAGHIRSIDVTVALLGLVCSVMAIANRGLLNRAAHRAVGLDAGVGAMTQTAAVGFAAQKLVKPAGPVGLAVFIRHGHRRGHAPGAVAAACLLTASASFVALGVVLTSAVFVLAWTDSLTGWWIAAAVAFAVYTLVLAPTAVLVLRSRRAAVWLWQRWESLRRRLPGKARRSQSAPFPEVLFDAIAVAKTRPHAVRDLLMHAVLSKLLGALALVMAVNAVGLPVDAAGALVVYATALAASMLTIVPGGLGTVEASTAALLIGAGATAGAAALAVALFRLFDLWVPVITGAAVARRDLRLVRRSADHDAGTIRTSDLARIQHWATSGSHL